MLFEKIQKVKSTINTRSILERNQKYQEIKSKLRAYAPDGSLKKDPILRKIMKQTNSGNCTTRNDGIFSKRKHERSKVLSVLKEIGPDSPPRASLPESSTNQSSTNQQRRTQELIAKYCDQSHSHRIVKTLKTSPDRNHRLMKDSESLPKFGVILPDQTDSATAKYKKC